MMSDGNRVYIEQKEQEKDIGVTFDKNLKFDVHISNTVNKANQRLGLIRRTFEYMESDTFLMLYTSLVRPLLEYATVIWSPWMKKDIIAIEQVQRRATKLVKDIQHFSYEERLIKLGLPTLIYRRERADMLQMFKILNQFDKVNLQSLKLNTDTKTRGHAMKVIKSHHNYRGTLNSFTSRAANPWNRLPEDCVNSFTVNSFKNNLNTAWKQKANKFCYDF